MGKNDATVVNDFDEWISFVDAMSKLKKNDNKFHNACLEHNISFYDSERARYNLPPIKNNIVHADKKNAAKTSLKLKHLAMFMVEISF